MTVRQTFTPAFKKGGIVLVTQKGCSVDKTVQAVRGGP